MNEVSSDAPAESGPSRKEELRVFLILTVLLAPVVSVAVVGGYGFLVWMFQLIYGPPSV